MELLPQTLEDFSVSSSGLGLRQGMLATVYRESEQLRRRKLQSAKREREMIIAEENGWAREGRNVLNVQNDSRSRETRSCKMKDNKTVLPMTSLTNKVHALVEKSL